MNTAASQISKQVKARLQQLNDKLDPTTPRIALLLAAGHGKRIRSDTSKMLHEIWGKPTVLRVADAVGHGLQSANQVIVVGIKGDLVATAAGPQSGRIFAYQENPALGLPAGTGDAVRTGLEVFTTADEDRDIYVFLGDMGLLTSTSIANFRDKFETSSADMMVLTGKYSGPASENYYGRILRVPSSDATGQSTGRDAEKVIEIKEYRDILSLEHSYTITFNSRPYLFERDELLGLREINTGVFAFKESCLRKYIGAIGTDNAQGELMLTDLIDIFNRNNLTVEAMDAPREEEIIAFNVKSVWRQMESIARRWVYERLMDIITIVDEEDFFIADTTVEHILALDEKRGPLDIVVGKGVWIGPNVRLNRRVQLGDNCRLIGNIVLAEGVTLGSSVTLSTYPEQFLSLEQGVEVLTGNILKGDLRVGRSSRIEAGVIMTGSDAHPLRLGQRVTVKGRSYLYGCQVDNDLLIEHSVLKKKHIRQVASPNGSIQPVRYILPHPEGLNSIVDI